WKIFSNRVVFRLPTIESPGHEVIFQATGNKPTKTKQKIGTVDENPHFWLARQAFCHLVILDPAHGAISHDRRPWHVRTA
ncbi:hypothetical protein, partial [Pseudomonas syringae group genomosp. 3]|uniref:hypothetical protein n=1 Tax=Pseudomonas syringae group genomosp. 3 TaxID=251701 RepID=UPI001C80FE92